MLTSGDHGTTPSHGKAPRPRLSATTGSLAAQCGIVPYFDDGPEEYGEGEITLPRIDTHWDGDGYAWRIVPEAAS